MKKMVLTIMTFLVIGCNHKVRDDEKVKNVQIYCNIYIDNERLNHIDEQILELRNVAETESVSNNGIVDWGLAISKMKLIIPKENAITKLCKTIKDKSDNEKKIIYDEINTLKRVELCNFLKNTLHRKRSYDASFLSKDSQDSMTDKTCEWMYSYHDRIKYIINKQ